MRRKSKTLTLDMKMDVDLSLFVWRQGPITVKTLLSEYVPGKTSLFKDIHARVYHLLDEFNYEKGDENTIYKDIGDKLLPYKDIFDYHIDTAHAIASSYFRNATLFCTISYAFPSCEMATLPLKMSYEVRTDNLTVTPSYVGVTWDCELGKDHRQSSQHRALEQACLNALSCVKR